MLHGGLPLLLAGREQGVEGITEGGRISSLVSAGAALVRGRQGPQPQLHGPGLAGLQGVLEQWRRLGPFTAGVDGPLLTLDQEAVEPSFSKGVRLAWPYRRSVLVSLSVNSHWAGPLSSSS